MSTVDGTYMEPLALWGHNPHTKPENKTVISGIKDYVCYQIPRGMFRQAGATFSDVRNADPNSRYDEIALQLFLQMLYQTANLPTDRQPDIYPYVQAWLEWIPSESLKHTAVGYRVHAVSLHDDVKFGTELTNMLHEVSDLHSASMSRKMNTRTSDPLCGLQTYQKWQRVTGREMYVRTICDRYSKTQDFTSKMNKILNPKIDLSSLHCPANPSRVFTLKQAFDNTPTTADPEFASLSSYVSTNGADPTKVIPTLEFPSDTHVVLLTPAQLHPKIFCSKYFPDHQHWMETQKAIPTKKIGEEYDENCQAEYDIRTSDDLERERLNGLADRSAFSDLARQSKARYNNDCLPVEHTDDFPAAYKEYQDWGVKAMQTQCLDPDACISEVISKMLLWRTKNHGMVIKHTIIDPTLSPFANRVIRLMEGYEQYYLMSTAHRMLYLVMHARYDAFRRDFGLHLNCFQAGEGATSKSFTFILMDRMSIPGTIEVLTYQTGKSDAVDGNRNDVVTVCHEAPPGMFRASKNPNADSSQEAMFKEKLTSQRVTCKTWCMDESTGKRSSRLTKSECIGVWMGATNDPPSDVEEALKTRFFWGNFEQQQRRGRDIDDCMNGERMMSTADHAIKSRLNAESMEEQYRVMLVEKAIWSRLIKDVDLTASNILIPRFKTKLTKNSIIQPGPRDWERVKIFARNQAIVSALEVVFNLPGGKHYGKVFSEEMIPDVEPYLRVTEEMVIFTLSLFADQFRSPVEHKILNTIWRMEKDSTVLSGPPNAKEGDDSVDYVKLPKLHQLARKINSRMPVEGGKTSTNNIADFLLKMTKNTTKARKYKMRQVGPNQTAPDGFPIPKEKSKASTIQSCIIGNDGVYVHVSHVIAHSQQNSDSVFDILASETHRYSSHKRMITACTQGPKWFHVLKVIDRKPGGKELHYKNVLANTATSRWITQTNPAESFTRTRDGYTIEKDIDVEVAEKWGIITGKDVQTPQETMESVLAAEKFEAYTRPDIRYPYTLIKESGSFDDIDDDLDDEITLSSNKRSREAGNESHAKKQKVVA